MPPPLAAYVTLFGTQISTGQTQRLIASQLLSDEKEARVIYDTKRADVARMNAALQAVGFQASLKIRKCSAICPSVDDKSAARLLYDWERLASNGLAQRQV